MESSRLIQFLNRSQVGLTLLCGLALIASVIVHFTIRNDSLSDMLAYVAVGFGSVFALRSAWEAISERRLDVNLLMVLAAIGAIVVGHADDAAVLLFLFSLSSTLESLAMARTEGAIESLIQLQPDSAIRISPEGDTTVRVEELQIGDTVRVLPFEAIPTDGEMLSQAADINESAVTGESRPASKSAGMSLIAGTQNLDTMLTMRVTKAVEDSTLSRIVALVRDAQENQTSGERIASWFGQTYTGFVIFATLLSLGIRMGTGAAFSEAFYSSLILLVALSPCALVISAPAASLSALAYAARRGILVRGGQFLEAAGNATVIALDKTGTLTSGKFEVAEICMATRALSTAGAKACERECDACTCITCWHLGAPMSEITSKALARIAAVEQHSTHPIAVAIVEHARHHKLLIPESTDAHSIPGLGAEAQVEGELVRVGQLKMYVDDSLPGGFREHVDEMRSRGLTAILAKTSDGYVAVGLRDTPRETSESLIRSLKSLGIGKITMLTGDNPETAQVVANEVGVDEVRAELLPADKFEIIKGWQAKGERVMMVGDGVNDAAALTQANLGIAMGGLGSEVAMRAADVVLVQDRVERIPELIALGRRTQRTITVNLVFAAGVILALTVASFFIRLPLPIAVMGHEGSTVLVILNGLRLLRGPGKLPS